MDTNAHAAWPAPPPFYRDGRQDPPEPPADGKLTDLMYGVSQAETAQDVAAAAAVEAGDGAAAIEELRWLNRELRKRFLQLLQATIASPSDVDARGACCPHCLATAR